MSKRLINDVAISAHPLTSGASLMPGMSGEGGGAGVMSTTPEGLKSGFSRVMRGGERSQGQIESRLHSLEESGSRGGGVGNNLHDVSINEISAVGSVGETTAREEQQHV